MRRLPLSLVSKVALSAWLVASAIGGCSLNPQPIPPGFQDPENATSASDASTTTTTPNQSLDAGNGGARLDGGTDEGDGARPPTPVLDASIDANLDAGLDSSSDAATDAGPDDGSVVADALAD